MTAKGKPAATRKRGDRRSPPGQRKTSQRLERILIMVPWIVAHPDVEVSELAERFDVSREEVVRDLEMLFMCGLPEYTPADLIDVRMDEDRVTIHMADYFQRPLSMTRAEAISLFVRGRAVADLLGPTTPDSALEPLRSALTKIAEVMLPGGDAAALTERIRVQHEAGEQRWLTLLRNAITEFQVVKLDYYTHSRDAVTSREIEPHLVFASGGHWYVTGWCRLAQDKRIFRLDRVREASATTETFTAPKDPTELPPAMVYVPSDKDHKVVLRVSGPIGIWLAEYLPTDKVTVIDDDTTEIRFRASALPWLEKLVLRFADSVEVVAPAELAEGARNQASRILAMYRK